MMSSQPGASVSGTPRNSVAMALAQISGPGMPSLVDVAWMSWRIWAVAPTIAILPATAPGGTWPRTAS